MAIMRRENARLQEENEHLQEELRDLREFVHILNDLTLSTKNISSDEELLPLLENIFMKALGLVNAPDGSLMLLDEETNELVFVVVRGSLAANLIGYRIPADEGIAGWVVQSGQPIAVSNLADDRRFARDVAESTGYVPSAMIAVPVESDDRVLGVLSVLDRDPDRSGAAGDLELATRFAAQAAAALDARAAFTDAGAVLLRALADAAGPGGELADALRAHAASSGRLTEIASLLGELNRSGDAERRLAVRILTDFLEYSRR
jgi:GAF domain-containing protein